MVIINVVFMRVSIFAITFGRLNDSRKQVGTILVEKTSLCRNAILAWPLNIQNVSNIRLNLKLCT